MFENSVVIQTSGKYDPTTEYKQQYFYLQVTEHILTKSSTAVKSNRTNVHLNRKIMLPMF